MIFSLAILSLGFAAYFGGLWMGKVGPRRVGMAAGLLYGVGIILASFSSSSIVLLYLTYGLLAGVGIGLGYIVPVATLINGSPTVAASSPASRWPASAAARWSPRRWPSG